ncbi:hypothetical protein JCM19992_31870 [Thermostilla marina]
MAGRPPRRLQREKKTVQAMIRLYCRDHHRSSNESAAGNLCDACAELLEYAFCRIDRCPFGGEKPTCANCPIHCYRPQMRESIRAVMRYAGPRMLGRHPYLALMHLLVDGRRRPPEKPPKRAEENR